MRDLSRKGKQVNPVQITAVRLSNDVDGHIHVDIELPNGMWRRVITECCVNEITISHYAESLALNDERNTLKSEPADEVKDSTK